MKNLTKYWDERTEDYTETLNIRSKRLPCIYYSLILITIDYYWLLLLLLIVIDVIDWIIYSLNDSLSLLYTLNDN